jgi:hypothetical protein
MNNTFSNNVNLYDFQIVSVDFTVLVGDVFRHILFSLLTVVFVIHTVSLRCFECSIK